MKNKIIISFFLSAVIFGCNSNDNKNENVTKEIVPDTITTITHSPDSMQTIINDSPIWKVEQGMEGKEKLMKPQTIILDTLSSSTLVQMINDNFPDIKLELVKVSHDTLYVKIPESLKLTDQIGDTGAENYLASVTFTLTETKNIKFINFNFIGGEHAMPGVFSRENFKTLR